MSAWVETETFDLKAFRNFAENYVVDKSDISGSCMKNSKISSDSGHYQSAQTWSLLSTLFCEIYDEGSTDGYKEDTSINPMNILLPIINYYADNSNSQMCVTIYSLFHGFEKFKEHCSDRAHIWYDSYLGMVITFKQKTCYLEILYIILQHF